MAESTNADWFPDTGATAHVTDNAGKLSNLVPYKGADSVMVGNGARLRISHVGTGNIPTEFCNIYTSERCFSCSSNSEKFAFCVKTHSRLSMLF